MASFNTLNTTTQNTPQDEFLLRQGGIDYKQNRELLAASLANARWESTANYNAGTEVIGSDNLPYVAVTPSGANFGGAVDPVGDVTGKWTAGVNSAETIADKFALQGNLISNPQFQIASPDNTLPLPSPTPVSYPPSHQVFSGWFADDSVGVTNLTYENGVLNATSGKIYTLVPNTGALQYVTDLVESLAGVDRKAFTDGISSSPSGDTYKIEVDFSVATDVFSVKFETGSVATGHEVGSISVGNLSDYTDIVYKASGGNSAVDNMIDTLSLNPIMYAVGTIMKTGGTTWSYDDSTGPITLDNFRAFNVAYGGDFGVKGDGSDDTDALQAAIDSKLPVVLPSGTFLISRPLEAEFINIKGMGIGSSLSPDKLRTYIRKTTTTPSTTPPRDGINYDVDSIISVVHPTGSYSYGTVIEGITLDRTTPGEYALYIPRSARGRYVNTYLIGCTYGLYAHSFWDNITNGVVASDCTYGYYLAGGSGGSTSWSATNTSTHNCTNGFYCKSLQYSTFTSCYSESTSGVLFDFRSSSNINLNSCGGEQPSGVLLNIASSRLSIDSWQSGELTAIGSEAAIKINDSEVTFNNSTAQDYINPSPTNLAVEVTGVGRPSRVLITNSNLIRKNDGTTNSAGVTVDDYSYYSDDMLDEKRALRGKIATPAHIVDSISNLNVFANTGNVTSAGVATGTFSQINNTLAYSIQIEDVVISGAGSGTVILDVPFVIEDKHYGAAVGGDGFGVCRYYQATRMRIDINSQSAATNTWSTSGVIRLQ